ncbi:Maf family protein [Solibaculum intestinale]|uniref:dTTP/UTP pyrophosphatase n=1 Tax=Solibaculum intestinale TaxID=3133165 RepID=A0ABV1DXT4_9FIRM
MALILASASPRRRELLERAGLSFACIPARGEEIIQKGTRPEQAALTLAQQKALEVAKARPLDTVIGADTIVVLDGMIMGKPRDEADAVRMLTLLSGREHLVLTGVCVVNKGHAHSFVQQTKVKFYPLAPAKIRAYVRTGEPMDKAGAYGIQEKGMALVEGIEGDFFNVMGLPIARLLRLLEELE